MKIFRKSIAVVLLIVFVINLCGCNSRIKTVKKTVITPVTEYRTRVIGQNIIGEEIYPDENENGIIDDFESGKSESSDTSKKSDDNDSSTEAPMTDNFIEGGSLNYRIIRSSSSDDYVTVVTRNLATEIKEKLGCNVNFKTDAISPSKNIRELIIGASNRPASAYAEKLLRQNRANCYYDSIVCTVGNDICIFAYEKEALIKATNNFVNTFCDGNTKKVPSDYSWIYLGNSSHTIYPVLSTFNIGDNNVSDYRIVIPKQYTSYEIGCATYLQYTIGTVTGTPVDIALDSVNSVGKEIHIGNTNRNITPPDNEEKYFAKVENGNLYYSSKSEELTYMVIKDLCETLKSVNGAYSIPSVHNIIGNYYDLKCSFGNGYNLVWYEEFDGVADDSVAKTEYGLDSKYWNDFSKKEYYDKAKVTYSTKTNVKLSGTGQLKMIADRVDERNYRGAEITTENKAYFKYGYMELRVKFAGGPGVSNVWWFNSNLSSKDRPEIDVYEQFGIEKTLTANLHSWNVGANSIHYDHGSLEKAGDWPFNRKFIPESTELIANNKYRIIAMEWTPDTITFYADGLPFCVWDIRNSIYQPFREYPVFTLLECYSHQNTTQGFGEEDARIQYIDYLRVYQRDSSAGYESFVSSSGAKVKGKDISMELPES